MWDLRRFSDTDDILEGLQVVREQAMRGWDYRWILLILLVMISWHNNIQVAEGSGQVRSGVRGDRSVMTYTGHSVLQTLIRSEYMM